LIIFAVMKKLVKAAIYMLGVMSTTVFRYLFLAIILYIAGYWLWIILSIPFQWMFR